MFAVLWFISVISSYNVTGGHPDPLVHLWAFKKRAVRRVAGGHMHRRNQLSSPSMKVRKTYHVMQDLCIGAFACRLNSGCSYDSSDWVKFYFHLINNFRRDCSSLIYTFFYLFIVCLEISSAAVEHCCSGGPGPLHRCHSSSPLAVPGQPVQWWFRGKHCGLILIQVHYVYF